MECEKGNGAERAVGVEEVRTVRTGRADAIRCTRSDERARFTTTYGWHTVPPSSREAVGGTEDGEPRAEHEAGRMSTRWAGDERSGRGIGGGAHRTAEPLPGSVGRQEKVLRPQSKRARRGPEDGRFRR